MTQMYRVWCPDQGETEERDAKQIDALDACSAAEIWAETDDYESADYSIVGGQEAEVIVRDVQTLERTRYVVVGESVAVYRASEVGDDDAD